MFTTEEINDSIMRNRREAKKEFKNKLIKWATKARDLNYKELEDNKGHIEYNTERDINVEIEMYDIFIEKVKKLR